MHKKCHKKRKSKYSDPEGGGPSIFGKNMKHVVDQKVLPQGTPGLTCIRLTLFCKTWCLTICVLWLNDRQQTKKKLQKESSNLYCCGIFEKSKAIWWGVPIKNTYLFSFTTTIGPILCSHLFFVLLQCPSIKRVWVATRTCYNEIILFP